MRDVEHSVERAVEWFMEQPRLMQKQAARELFDYAIRSEWIGVWSDEDIDEMSAEGDRDIDELRAPYLRSCGEPIGGSEGTE